MLLDLRDTYNRLFYEETEEQLDSLEEILLHLDISARVEMEKINHIFRLIHSLKGAFVTMDYIYMGDISHEMESTLSAIRERNLELTNDIIDSLLEAVDALKIEHKNLISNEINSASDNDVPDRGKLKIFKIAGNLKDVKPVSEGKALENLGMDGEIRITIEFEKTIQLVAVKAFLIIQRLKEQFEVKSISPTNYEELEDEAFDGRIIIFLSENADVENIETLLDTITEIKKITIDKIDNNAFQDVKIYENRNLIPLEEPTKYDNSERAYTNIKVPYEKVDEMINLLGEIVMDRETLNYELKDLKEKCQVASGFNKIMEILEHTTLLHQEMQDRLLKTRLIPLGALFRNYPRMVRDLSTECGKRVDIIIKGENQGIDRMLIESLKDPLNHIIRNSVDHGIELPEARIAAGKNVNGRITLLARQEENEVVIEIEDDGMGIDAEEIKKMAIAKGVVIQSVADEYNEAEAYSLLFHPGFSTKKSVSNISGRGVGLDVVKSNIEALRGKVSINSVKGLGTKFEIRLPITLSLFKAMIVRENEFIFAFPSVFVNEILRIKDIKLDEGIKVIQIGDVFEIEKDNYSFLLSLSSGNKGVLMEVSELLGEREVVVKSLKDYLGEDKILGNNIPLSGVSILGSGKLAYIVDVVKILEEI